LWKVNLYLTIKYMMETNNLHKKFCDECGKEITDINNICHFHRKDGLKIYRHKQCKKENENDRD